MTTAQVVETSVTVNNNSPIQDYVHPDDQTQPTFEMTPGFKPFTMLCLSGFDLYSRWVPLMNHLSKLRGERHVMRLRNPTEDKRAFRRMLTSADRPIECFHMTSRRPYSFGVPKPKTMKRRPCWCAKPILWELNSFLLQTLSFVPINWHRCWPRE